MTGNDYAVAIIIHTPAGYIPCVYDPEKRDPRWKFPGGRSKHGENAEEAIVREVQEELALDVKGPKLRRLIIERRDNHDFVCFQTWLPSLNGMRTKGDEGQLITVFTLEEILLMKDGFFQPHRNLLDELMHRHYVDVREP